jgi:hypothetical protein
LNTDWITSCATAAGSSRPDAPSVIVSLVRQQGDPLVGSCFLFLSGVSCCCCPLSAAAAVSPNQQRFSVMAGSIPGIYLHIIYK